MQLTTTDFTKYVLRNNIVVRANHCNVLSIHAMVNTPSPPPTP